MFDFAITLWLGGKDAGAYVGPSRDWVETYAAPPVPASGLGADPNTGREINLPRLSPKETSRKDSYDGSGPCWVIQCSVGGFVGKASNAHHKTAFISSPLSKRPVRAPGLQNMQVLREEMQAACPHSADERPLITGH